MEVVLLLPSLSDPHFSVLSNLRPSVLVETTLEVTTGLALTRLDFAVILIFVPDILYLLLHIIFK